MSLACCARSIVILAVALVSGLPAVADARRHRFPPSQELTVSFKLAKGNTHGTIVRFMRNRLALGGPRPGALELRGKGLRTLRVARPAERSLSVGIRVSALRRTVELTAGRRRVSMTGRFVAEDGVAVRSGAKLRSLRITPRRSPIPTQPAGPAEITRPDHSPTPGPPSSPAPESPAMPAPGPAEGPASADAGATAAVASATTTTTPKPLFAPDSVWNKPVPVDAPLDPGSAVLVKKLSDTIRDGFAAGRASWIQTTNGSTPLYIAPPATPTVRVTLDAGAWATSLQQAFAAVPIPPNAAPAAGVDGHMTIWQPSTNKLWEFFKARKLTDGWHASFGGAISGVTTFPGYYSDTSWPGLSHFYWGATATSLPVIAGTMLLSELRAGVIPHALAMNIPYARPKVYSWPAQRTDGTSTDPAAIPEGARFRLDPTLDLSKLNLPPMTRMMAVAAQRYGMIVRDQTSWAVAVFAEDPTPTGTSPFYGPGGFYGGRLPSDLMKAFPWDRLQLLKMDLRGG